MIIKRLYFYPILFLISLFWACTERNIPERTTIDLSGQWRFALDTADIGRKENWHLMNLADRVTLPGTTDTNQKGYYNQDTTSMHLNRLYKYEGAAWYQKSIVIPEGFRNKRVTLHLERSKVSEIWIDDNKVGESKLLQAPQVYELSEYLSPGEHILTIRVDNSLDLTPYGHVHIYSDDTQTNWNGILGDIYLESTSLTFIKDMQVYPDVDGRKVDIKLSLTNPEQLEQLDLELVLTLKTNERSIQLPPKKIKINPSDSLIASYELDDQIALWDEYDQPLYELTVILSNEKPLDAQTVTFGMRKFEVTGKQFSINNRKTFLRGKHEAGVFPITGHIPMDVESWVRVYEIAKSYGINHYRFHSYCPPEAAFIAADQVGIYLQAELPFWGGLESDTVAFALREEGYAMLKAYANHPSFVLFSHGNEIWSGHERTEANIAALKAFDDRPLYTFGSNNSIGYQPPSESSEFFVAARNPVHGDSILGHTRLTHAFADAQGGATLNTQTPNTTINFDFAISNVDIPLISHEIGQYQIYPDYDEIDKYTGVLKAWNLNVFKDSLNRAGMLDQDSIFQKASGAWSALCYKAEMEAAFRTQSMGGFQLLDLQDFPGQGTALVGILDAFMDNKEVVSKKEWLQSCNDVVLLGEFEKYVWNQAEEFTAHIRVANYSNKNLHTPVKWQIANNQGEVLESGSITDLNLSMGKLSEPAAINIDLAAINTAQQLSFTMELDGTDYSNEYPIWVYPMQDQLPAEDIQVVSTLSEATLQQLEAGASVLLFPNPDDIQSKSVAGHFPPEFWNYGMFKGISEWVKKPVSPGTLGLLMDPKHPIFRDFPTDYHTNWQWFSIIKASRSIFLNDTKADYRPIVQVIDNLERNYKMGMIFEFKVGEGKLLVCSANLLSLRGKPEARQLYNSILTYMGSTDFDPNAEIKPTQLKELL